MKKTLLGVALILLTTQAQAVTLSWDAANSYAGMIIDSNNGQMITAHVRGGESGIPQQTLNMSFNVTPDGNSNSTGASSRAIEFDDSQMNVTSVILDGKHTFTQKSLGDDVRRWVLSSINLSEGLHTIAVNLGLGGIKSHGQFDLKVVTPIPAAVWLFGSALAGLMGFGKRKKVTFSSVV